MADYLLQSPVGATGLVFSLFLSFKVRIFCHDVELSIRSLWVIVFSFMGSLLLGGEGAEWIYDMIYYYPALLLVNDVELL